MKTVGILARRELAGAGAPLSELLDSLASRGVQALLEDRTATLLPKPPPPGSVAPAAEVAKRADVLVVLGGDGTLLRANSLLEGRSVPVLGVNFGSLGFLTEITLAELKKTLEGVLEGTHTCEERRLLSVAVRSPKETRASQDILNDVVLTKGGVLSRIIEFDVFVDGSFVSAFRADGLIISSPTGSTAYNLAAGGPLLHPTLAAMVLTPICPHMLTNRPLVLNDSSEVQVRFRPARDSEVHVTLDGQRGLPLHPEDTVTVTRSPRTLSLVKAVGGRDYFEVLRTKLKWGAFGQPRT
jgi:NAD+ kinase